MAKIFNYKDKTPKIAKDVFIAPKASVVGDVEIGAGSSVWFGSVIRGDLNKIKIGERVNIQDNATIHTMGDEEVVIDDDVVIGHNAVVHCSKIGKHCLIGMGSIIMGYAEIGEYTVIRANTYIEYSKRIPSYSLVGGNPAKIIRRLREDEIEAVAASCHRYAELAQEYREDYEKNNIV